MRETFNEQKLESPANHESRESQDQGSEYKFLVFKEDRDTLLQATDRILARIYGCEIDPEDSYSIPKDIESIIKVQKALRDGTATLHYDVIMFLDKSARPLSHLLSERIKVLAHNEDKKSNTMPVPEIKFLNFDRATHSQRSSNEGGKFVMDESLHDSITEAQALYGRHLKDKKVLVVDDFSVSSPEKSTRRYATELIKTYFPVAAAKDALYTSRRSGETGGAFGAGYPWSRLTRADINVIGVQEKYEQNSGLAFITEPYTVDEEAVQEIEEDFAGEDWSRHKSKEEWLEFHEKKGLKKEQLEWILDYIKSKKTPPLHILLRNEMKKLAHEKYDPK